MGIWLEQLISESSGKDNKGASPVISYIENEKIKFKNIYLRQIIKVMNKRF